MSPAPRRPTRKQRTHLVDMLQTARANQDRVPALAAHETMVRDPAQRDLRHREPVRGCCVLHELERVEVVLVPVARAVVLVRVSSQ